MEAGRIVTVIQARMTSTRLPRKALLQIAGKSMLEHVIAAAPEPRIVALPNEFQSLEIVQVLAHLDVSMFIPDASVQTDDVLGRFVACVEERFPQAQFVLRLTADCPMLSVEPGLVQYFIDNAIKSLSIGCHPGCMIDAIVTNRPYDPDGYDMELFPVRLLKTAHAIATTTHDREHVTSFMYRHFSVTRFSVLGRGTIIDDPTEKVSVDTAADYDRVRRLMEGQKHAVS